MQNKGSQAILKPLCLFFARSLAWGVDVLGKDGNSALLAQAYIGLGNARAGGIQEPHYKQALVILGETGNISIRAQALIGLGNARADGVQAPHYEQALRLLKGSDNIELCKKAHLALGRVYFIQRRNIDGMLQYYKYCALEKNMNLINSTKKLIEDKKRYIKKEFLNISQNELTLEIKTAIKYFSISKIND